MLDLHFSPSYSLALCVLAPLILLIVLSKKPSRNNSLTKLVKSYPIIGSLPEIARNKDMLPQWFSQIVTSAPNLTFSYDILFGDGVIVTSDASNVRHILKTNFGNYRKCDDFKTCFGDLFGDFMFILDGESWKSQRQVISRELSTKSFRDLMVGTVDDEVLCRLVQVLKNAADTKCEVDLQDILERLFFDSICRLALGHDPGCLSPSLPKVEFAVEFEEALRISFGRLLHISPYIWKLKRALNIGSEKRLKIAANHISSFVKNVARKKMKQLRPEPSVAANDDIMSKLLSANVPEDLAADIAIGLLFAGRDTTSSALTYFFWLLSNHPEVEREILNEVKGQAGPTSYDDMKKMVYTHASVCESMRLHPPGPLDDKQAVEDDVLPDGTMVKKGTKVTINIYAMGRVESVWGPDWDEFRPTRWLETEPEGDMKWRFVGPDSYTYPVFWAGPRICLGKDMALFQMKRIVAAVLQRFKVVPTMRGGGEPIHELVFTSRMRDGFKVRIEERVG